MIFINSRIEIGNRLKLTDGSIRDNMKADSVTSTTIRYVNWVSFVEIELWLSWLPLLLFFFSYSIPTDEWAEDQAKENTSDEREEKVAWQHKRMPI